MSQKIIAVVGPGYVGVPLTVEFGKKFTTAGYDLSEREIASFPDFRDPPSDVPAQSFRSTNWRSRCLNTRLVNSLAAAMVAQEYVTH